MKKIMFFLLSLTTIAKPMQFFFLNPDDDRKPVKKKTIKDTKAKQLAPKTREQREERYARINSFFDAFLAGRFNKDTILKTGVVFKHYEQSSYYSSLCDARYSMHFDEVNKLIYAMHKKAARITDLNRNNNLAQELAAIESDLKQGGIISERRKNIILRARFADFVSAPQELGTHWYRNIYRAAWATKDPKIIKNACSYQLYCNIEPYVPLADHLSKIKYQVGSNAETKEDQKGIKNHE